MEPLALPIRARLSRYTGARTARLTDAYRASRAAGFFAVLLALGGGLVLLYSRPGRAAGLARAIPSRLHRGGDRVRAARRR